MAPTYDEISILHPNNPASPRYWKNIIPESQLIETRAGVSVLPVISDSDKLDIILGFGNEYNGDFSIDGETYSGYIEIYITLYDQIKEIQFKLTGINLPYIPEFIDDVNFDGIVNVVDIVIIVDFVLNLSEPTNEEFLTADLNQDDIVNILDVIQIVSQIIGTDFRGSVEWLIENFPELEVERRLMELDKSIHFAK